MALFDQILRGSEAMEGTRTACVLPRDIFDGFPWSCRPSLDERLRLTLHRAKHQQTFLVQDTAESLKQG